MHIILNMLRKQPNWIFLQYFVSNVDKPQTCRYLLQTYLLHRTVPTAIVFFAQYNLLDSICVLIAPLLISCAINFLYLCYFPVMALYGSCCKNNSMADCLPLVDIIIRMFLPDELSVSEKEVRRYGFLSRWHYKWIKSAYMIPKPLTWWMI